MVEFSILSLRLIFLLGITYFLLQIKIYKNLFFEKSSSYTRKEYLILFSFFLAVGIAGSGLQIMGRAYSLGFGDIGIIISALFYGPFWGVAVGLIIGIFNLVFIIQEFTLILLINAIALGFFCGLLGLKSLKIFTIDYKKLIVRLIFIALFYLALIWRGFYRIDIFQSSNMTYISALIILNLLGVIAFKIIFDKLNLLHNQKDSRIIAKLDTLCEMIKKVHSVTNIYQTLESVLDIACELLDAQAGGIMTVEEDGMKKCVVKENNNQLFMRVVKNLNRKLVPDEFNIKGTVIESVIKDLKVIKVEKSDLETDFIFIQKSGYDNLLIAPLTKGDEIYGVLFLAKASVFENEDLQMIKPIATQGSILIKNNQLFEKMQKNVAELSTLQRISKIINCTLNLDQVLELTIDVIIGTMGVSACAVMLIDDKEQALKLEASRGLPEEFKKIANNINIDSKDNIFTKIIKDKETMFYNQASLELKEELGFKDMKSIIALPLKFRDDVNGIIIAINTLIVNSFNEDDKRFLITLSNQVAIAIENATMYNQMEEMAIRDGLTQLYNHSYFQESLADEIERANRYGQRLSLLLLDIDNFKDFNDNYGHQLGDKVLKMLAKSLKKVVRDIDIVARYGGEEFVIILPETGLTGVQEVGNRINKAIREMNIQEGNLSLNVTVSIGAATYQEGLSQEKLINQADRALYKAKEEGKDRTCII